MIKLQAVSGGMGIVMRIGICSPFSPMHSGISDFSEELVVALEPYAEIVLFSPVKPDNKNLLQNFEVHMLSELDDPKLRSSLNLIVYHVGNNYGFHGGIVEMLKKYSGVVELHEVGLHHFAEQQLLEGQGKDAYIEAVRYCHGERGVKIAEDYFNGLCNAPWDDHALDMCMNRIVVDSASAIITHSDMVKQMILGMRPDLPIANIMLHAGETVENPATWKAQCREKMGFSSDGVIFGSIGFATAAKRIVPILDALQQYREEVSDAFLYLIVGEEGKGMHLAEQIQDRGLGENVRVTGFVSLEDMKAYMGACDFILNLRYPTQGESSASLHRALGMGKPVILTDVGTFGDYPEDFALKVRHDEGETQDIFKAIRDLAMNKEETDRRGAVALEYAREHCDLEKNAKAYFDFFDSLNNQTWQPDHVDTFIGRLITLGLTQEGYLEHLNDQLGGALEIVC